MKRIDNDYGSFSFGTIYRNTSVHADPKGINTLRHEYGHTVQLDNLGAVDYALLVVPSFTCATLDHLGLLNIDYYSLPWEFEADMYGNVVSRNSYEEDVIPNYLFYRAGVQIITKKRGVLF